jgi:hypothetical protein
VCMLSSAKEILLLTSVRTDYRTGKNPLSSEKGREKRLTGERDFR